MGLRAGQEVFITEGEVEHPVDPGQPDGPVELRQLDGMRAHVDEDATPYVSPVTGKPTVVVHAAEEHGGGMTAVAVDRLRDRSINAGYSPRYSAAWDRVFGRQPK